MIEIDLSGHLAVVTGGSGQLGRAIVRTLASCGADVAIHYHKNADQALMLRDGLVASGRNSGAFQADVTDPDSVAKMAEAISQSLRQPDIVVDNAVVQYDWKPVLDQDLVDYESQFRSCVIHNVLMAKAFVPSMVSKRWGRVIAINTECAMQNFPSQSAYVAGKRGMDGVLRVLAKEVGEHQVTVNQVAPGWMVSENVADDSPAYNSGVPLKRRGTDRDIANVVAFLASDLAGFITGAFIPVCGGNVMPAI